jgi:hypothetical protein
MGEAHEPGVLPIEEDMGAVLLRVIEGYSVLQVVIGKDQLSQIEELSALRADYSRP